MNYIKFTLFKEEFVGWIYFNFYAMFLLSLWFLCWFCFITFCTPNSIFFIKKFFLTWTLSYFGLLKWYRCWLSIETDCGGLFWIIGKRFLLLLKNIYWFDASNLMWLKPSWVILIWVYYAYLWKRGDAAFCLKIKALLNYRVGD